ncbi:unnamed protein product [Prunus brigantina]
MGKKSKSNAPREMQDNIAVGIGGSFLGPLQTGLDDSFHAYILQSCLLFSIQRLSKQQGEGNCICKYLLLKICLPLSLSHDQLSITISGLKQLQSIWNGSMQNGSFSLLMSLTPALQLTASRILILIIVSSLSIIFQWIQMLKNCSTSIKINFLRYEQSSQCKTMRDISVSYASAAAKVDA